MIRHKRIRQTEADKPIFDLVATWREAYPQWLRDADAANGELDSMWEMAADPHCVCIGIWSDLHPKAILVFRHTGGGWFEVHLEAERGFDRSTLEKVAWEWGWRLFEQLDGYCIYAWIADVHKVSRNAANFLCLTYDGTVRWHGVVRGRLVRWRRHALYRSTWLEWLRMPNEQQSENGNAATAEPELQSESVAEG